MTVKKGLFHTIKDLLIVPEPDKPPTPAVETEAAEASSESPSPAPISRTSSRKGSARNSAVDPAYAELMKGIEDSGPAYTDLVSTLKSLEESVEDEGMRYRAALGVLGRKTSVEKILSAIDERLTALKDERRKFASHVEAETNEVAGLQDQVAEKKKEISDLKKQQEKKQAELDDLQKQVKDGTDQIGLIQEGFETAYGQVETFFKTERDKITNYLNKPSRKGGK